MTEHQIRKARQEAAAFHRLLDPIRNHPRPILREKAEQLKRSDGESWAIGELLERACIMLDALPLEGTAPPRAYRRRHGQVG